MLSEDNEQEALDLPVSCSAGGPGDVAANSAGLEADTYTQTAAVLIESLTDDAVQLAASFKARMATLQQSVQEAADCTLEHVLAYDTAVSLLQEASVSTTAAGEELIASAVRLSRELRGVNKVAERIRGIRQSLVLLEAQIDKIK